MSNAAAGCLVYAVRGTGLATLPTDFDCCYRAASIPDFDPMVCFVFGGPTIPPNDVCCRNCPAKKFAVAARDSYKERTGEAIYLVEFYHTRLDWKSHPFVERMRHAAWMSRDHGL